MDVKSLGAAIALLVSIVSTQALAFGNEGHRTIGAMADQLLVGTKAEQEVKKLLSDGNLERYAVWPDCAKGKKACRNPPWFTKEMEEFAKATPRHKSFHYTDIPIQEPRYKEKSVGAGPNDIVHIIPQCIAALKGAPKGPENPNGFSPRIALILLAHLVGDIHQPLHTGATYVATVGAEQKFVNPNGKPKSTYAETEGGNFLILPVPGDWNLHSYWDTALVEGVGRAHKTKTPAALAAALLKSPPADWKTPGDPMTWAEVWANEALRLAVVAYKDMKLGPRESVTTEHGTHPQWRITNVPKHYQTKAGGRPAEAQEVAETQLAKAGFRLAEILKAVWP